MGNKIRHSTFKNIRPHGQEGVSGDGSNAQAIYLVRYLVSILARGAYAVWFTARNGGRMMS